MSVVTQRTDDLNAARLAGLWKPAESKVWNRVEAFANPGMQYIKRGDGLEFRITLEKRVDVCAAAPNEFVD